MDLEEENARAEFARAKSDLMQLRSRREALVAALEDAYRTLHGTARRERLAELRTDLKLIKPQIDGTQALLLQYEDGSSRLNVDMWLQIFNIITSAPVDREGYILRGRSIISYGAGAPYALASVCRAWRDLVLATPSLWATFHFSPLSFQSKRDPPLAFKSKRPHRWANVHKALRLQLTRSAASPLNVTVDLQHYYTAYHRRRIDVNAAVGIFRDLARQSERWQHIDLTVTSERRIRKDALFHINRVTPVPLLRTLRIRLHQDGFAHPRITIPDACPLLQVLVYDGHPFAPGYGGLSTSSLTRLDLGLEGWWIEHLWNLLCAAPPTLVSLSLAGRGDPHPRRFDESYKPPRSRTSIRRLEFDLLGVTYLSGFIGHLDLRYVQELIIRSPERWHFYYRDIIQSLRESVTVLKLVSGGRSMVLDEHWARQLGELHLVQEFRDEVGGESHDFWDTLAKDMLWPRLEVIHSTIDQKLLPGGDRSLMLQALGELIVERNQQSNNGGSVRRLREVRVDADEDKQQWLNGLIER